MGERDVVLIQLPINRSVDLLRISCRERKETRSIIKYPITAEIRTAVMA